MGEIDLPLTYLVNPEEARQLAAAYRRHCEENHNADFEACDDPQCKAACELEILLIKRVGDAIARHELKLSRAQPDTVTGQKGAPKRRKGS